MLKINIPPFTYTTAVLTNTTNLTLINVNNNMTMKQIHSHM